MAKRDLNVKIDGDPRGFIRASRRSAAEAKRLADELDRLNKKKDLDGLTKAAAEAGKSFGDLFGDIGRLGPAQVGLLAAAILALPAAAGVAAAGVTTSLGGALASLGLVAAAQSAKVRGEFLDLKDDLGGQLQDAAAPLERSLLKVPDVAREAFASIEPELAGAFADLAPHIDTFVARIGAGAAELEPALDPLADGFGALLDALGGRSDVIFRNLSDAVTDFAETTEEHADDVAAMIEGISAAVAGAAKATGYLADEWDRFLADLEPVAEYFSGSDSEIDLDNSGAAASRSAQAAADAAKGWLDMSNALGDTKLSADALQKELGELNASLEEDEAASRYQEALDQVSASIKRNGRTLDIHTEKGRANRDSLRAQATTAKEHIVAMANEGATVGKVGKTYSGYRRELYAALRAAGETKAGARKLVAEWLRVPKSVSTRVDAKTAKANSAISAVQSRLNGLRDRVVRVTVAYSATGRAIINGTPSVGAFDRGATGGLVTGSGIRRAAGGYISGPGTGTSDSIPALLSNGEYVINAKATSRHRELLEAINTNRFAAGGPVRGYASGGIVSRATVPISEFIDRFLGDARNTSRSDVTKALRARKDAVDQLRRAERKLAEDRRKHRSARTIADDEARVRKERRDLQAATEKLSRTETAYRRAKLSPVAKLRSGLALGIKNVSAFLRNIKKIDERGYSELARQLVEMGGPEAERTAAEAAKLGDSKLRSLNKQVTTAARRQATLDRLPQILAVREAQRRGGTNPALIAQLTGLGEDEVVEVLKAMRGYASGGIERYARGGRRPGPGIVTRPTVLFGEGNGPEAFIPYDPAHRGRAVGLVNRVAADLGMRRATQVTQITNVNVTVQVPPTANKAEIGRVINDCLADYQRKGGRIVTATAS